MEIKHPTPETLPETLRLAFGHLKTEDQSARISAILDQFAAGQIPLEGIFQAWENGQMVGALFSQARTDGCQMLWSPTMLEGRSTAPFFEPFDKYCRKLACPAALALVDFRQEHDEQSLLSIGRFEYLSDLIYMVLILDQVKAPQIGESEYLQFESLQSFSGSDKKRLETLVKASYQNSRDFPRLMGILPVDKVLDGYRNGSEFDPSLWFFVRGGNRDIGVLLMSDFPEKQIELTYMGLIEDVRGRGFGREIVRFAHQTARDRRCTVLLTAVDEQNTAAVRSYQAQGFQAWDRKKIYVRFF